MLIKRNILNYSHERGRFRGTTVFHTKIGTYNMKYNFFVTVKRGNRGFHENKTSDPILNEKKYICTAPH